MRVVNLADMFGRFEDTWSPRVVGELNGQHVKLARLDGEFVWHHHEAEDELFLVVKGRLRMRVREAGADERELAVHEGEFLIVPRGVEHLPIADEECQVLLFEPVATLNTGNVQDSRTVAEPKRL
jgi:mannose-6-phosphate isomerase-like protein (cupin superfamily)